MEGHVSVFSFIVRFESTNEIAKIGDSDWLISKFNTVLSDNLPVLTLAAGTGFSSTCKRS